MNQHCAILCVAVGLVFIGRPSRATEDWFDNVKGNVVIVHAVFETPDADGSRLEDGAAIVVGSSKTAVTIVTADHVVLRGPELASNIELSFAKMKVRVSPDDVRLDTALRIAVIQVPNTNGVLGSFTHRFKLPPPRESAQTSPCGAPDCRNELFYLGRDESGLPEIRPLSGSLGESSSLTLKVDRADLHPGNSGGAIVDRNGRLLGLVQKTSQVESKVTRFVLIAEALKIMNADCNLIERFGSIRFNSVPSGSQLSVDNEPNVDISPANHITAGAHTLSLNPPGNDPASWTLVIADGQSFNCDAALASDATRFRRNSQWWFIGGSSAVVAAGLTGLIMGNSKKEAFQDTWSESDYQQFKTWNTASSITLTVGAVALATSVVWALSGSTQKTSQVSCKADTTSMR